MLFFDTGFIGEAFDDELVFQLDQLLGGLHKSDLIILAGRPSMGKTALATNIAFNAAKAYREEIVDGKPNAVDGAVVGFFSLEMSSEQLATRVLADVAQIQSHRIQRGEGHGPNSGLPQGD